MDYEDRAADLIAVLRDRLIDEALAADDVPAAVGIEGTSMVTTLGFIVIIVIFYEERSVFRKGIDDMAAFAW